MGLKLTTFYSKYKINNKKLVKKKILVIPVFLAIALIVGMIFIFGGFKNSIWIDECEMYFVVADSNLSNSHAENLKSRVEDAGGSGVVADIGEYKNCVVILSYLNENDAEKIKNNCLSMFPNTHVLCIKSSRIRKNSQIKNNFVVQETLRFIIDNKYESLENILKFEKGDLNFSKLYEYGYKLKASIEKYYKMLGDSELEERLRLTLSKLQIILNAFLQNNLVGEFSSTEFKKYIVTLMIEEKSIREIFI